MKYSIIKILVGTIIILSTFSCSQDNTKGTIGYLYPSKNRVRFLKEGNYMIEKLEELGYKTTMVDAEDNDALQIERGLEMIKQGLDLMVIAPVNGNTIAPVVREANNKGIPVIAYNRLINNVDYDMFFTGDNKDNGRIFCEAALKHSPTGNYVILAGDRFDRNGVELKQAIDTILAPKINDGSIRILYESYIESWNKQNAKFELEQVIQSYGTDIDAVIACSDPMAQGTIEVLEKYDLAGKVFVCGQDALLQSVKYIYEGLQNITIYHPHKVLGNTVAELADKILTGKKPEELANAKTFNGRSDIPTLQVKSVAVTKDNIEEELIATGEYTRGEIKN